MMKKTLCIFTGVVLLCGIAFISYNYLDDYQTMDTPSSTAVYKDKTKPIEARVADLLSQMTLKEKIGQMALVEKNSLEAESDIASYNLGALLSGAGSKPEVNTPGVWKTMIDGFQEQAKQTRLGIPLLYGADAIHGHAHVETATVFPHALGLGATNNPQLVREIGRATAEELFATGVNWSFSPNLDQPQDIRWGRVYETFSDDPVLVSNLGVAYLEGLQEYDNSQSGQVFILGTLKHFLGLGGMVWGSSLNKNFKIDQGVTSADEKLLIEKYLPPYARAVEAGALSVMVGLNTWGDKRMVLRKELLTDTLKEELGFKGFVVSDWYGVHEGRKNKFWATVQAVNAGVDMVMLPFDYEEFVTHLTWANRLGLVSNARIDDAAGRILYTKFALGLFDEERELRPSAALGNTEHTALARKAVAESQVLLKNEDELVPLSKNVSHIRVGGSAADNVGKQMGAWTIEWQGIDGESPAEGTSILEAIKSTVSGETRVEYDALGNFAVVGKKVPVGIAVVGERPYAEGWGDTAYPILSDDDLQAIKNLQATCEKVVVVIVSGRPLLIAEEVASFDALVAAWLPGSEGAGVTDVLFGDKPYVGTLPLAWPKYAEQLPLIVGNITSDGSAVLFPRYFGLKTK